MMTEGPYALLSSQAVRIVPLLLPLVVEHNNKIRDLYAYCTQSYYTATHANRVEVCGFKGAVPR